MARGMLKATMAGLAVAVGVLAGAADAAAQTTWKMHVVWVPARPEAQDFKMFADLVNDKAKGKLKIEVFAGGSLGVKDVDMLRILPAGNVIQAAGLYPGYMTRDVPEYAATLPPGVIKDPERMVGALPALTKIYNETYDKWGIKLLGYVMHPVRDTHIACKEPITSLAQLKGKKLRVWEKFHVDTFAALGVSAQVIGQNDLYVAAHTGVVDCSVYPMGFMTSISLQEVQPNASYLFPYVLHPLNIIVAKKSFDTLPPDVQKIVADAAQQVQKATIDNYLKGAYDKKAFDEFTKKGGRLIESFSEADQATFAKTANDIWAKTAKDIGKKAEDSRAALLKATGG